jgi:RNA polymerase sigma-70 factor (ECF subfamily)
MPRSCAGEPGMRSLNHWLGDLYRHHHRDLVRFAARLVGNRDNGEEVVQNTYLRLAGRSADAVLIEHPKTYIFAAARNAAVDFTARQNAEWLHRVDFDEIDSLAHGDDPTAALHHRQRILRLAVVLNELPPACQTAFLLNKVEGRPHREIAHRLGVSVSMVEKHIMRALVHCRDLMRDDGEF